MPRALTRTSALTRTRARARHSPTSCPPLPAVFSGDADQVNGLLDAATSRGDLASLLAFQEPTLNDSTPLHVALGEGEGDVAAELIRRGAPLAATDGNGSPALHHLATFRDAGEASDDEDDDDGPAEEPVESAGEARGVEAQGRLLDLLLSKGADLNAADAAGRTVLHAAAEAQNVPMLRLLLAAAADVGALDLEGNTALHVAAEAANVLASVLLVEAGADAALANAAGHSAQSLEAARAGKLAELDDCGWTLDLLHGGDAEDGAAAAAAAAAAPALEEGATVRVQVLAYADEDEDDSEAGEDDGYVTETLQVKILRQLGSEDAADAGAEETKRPPAAAGATAAVDNSADSEQKEEAASGEADGGAPAAPPAGPPAVLYCGYVVRASRHIERLQHGSEVWLAAAHAGPL